MNKKAQLDFDIDEEWIFAAGLGLLAAIVTLAMYHFSGTDVGGFWKIATFVVTFIVSTVVCKLIFSS